MINTRNNAYLKLWRRSFSSSAYLSDIRGLGGLPDRIYPRYQETPNGDHVSLQWTSPPQNVLLVQKEHAPEATQALLDFATHIYNTYPSISIILEPLVAQSLHDRLPFPVYTPDSISSPYAKSGVRDANYLGLHRKVDLTGTFGGDGTILRAASLFASHSHVPPIISFSMGTLGFLGEWKFRDYKTAFREVYMSRTTRRSQIKAPNGERRPQHPDLQAQDKIHTPDSSSRLSTSSNLESIPETSINHHHHSLPKTNIKDTTISKPAQISDFNQALQPPSIPLKTEYSPIPRLIHWPNPASQPTANPAPNARVLLRNRLKVTLTTTSHQSHSQSTPLALHATNELILHRGSEPHLLHINITLNARHLTSAIADGIIVSTPTGSTAYSLSSGGSIVHPLVPSILLTPVCPRSLSFRPLVLPANTEITLRLNEKSRARDVEISVDGVSWGNVESGMEIKVCGEDQESGGVGSDGKEGERKWGVPCVIRAGDDGWVSSLNGLLKFNHPFGEEG